MLHSRFAGKLHKLFSLILLVVLTLSPLSSFQSSISHFKNLAPTSSFRGDPKRDYDNTPLFSRRSLLRVIIVGAIQIGVNSPPNPSFKDPFHGHLKANYLNRNIFSSSKVCNHSPV